MNLRGMKKVHDDNDKAIFKNPRGHEVRVAKTGISKKYREELEKLPLYAAEGDVVTSGKELPPYMQDEANATSVETGEPMTAYAGATPPPELNYPEGPAKSPVGHIVDFVKKGGLSPDKSMGDVWNSYDKPESSGDASRDLQQAPQAPQPTQPEPQAPQAQQPAQNPQSKSAPQPKTAADHTAVANQESAAFYQDLRDGNITPKTYQSLFDNKDTLGKIGTLFGLMVSGAGSGLAHQPNMVLDMMNKEIDRDLEAQKQNKENKLNFWKASQQNEMNKANVNRANAETINLGDIHAKNNMLLSGLHFMQSNVDNYPPGSPQRAQAQQVANGVQQAGLAEVAQNNQMLGERQFQMKQQNLGMMGMLGMEGANEMRRYNAEVHVPGFGDSTIPVPQEVRQELIAKKEYDQAARNYVDFAKKHQANWANLNAKDRMEVARRGAVMGADLQGKYRTKTHGGVYKTGEQEFIQKSIPDNAVSWMSSFDQIPKVQQTIDSNRADTDILAKGAGLSGGFPGGQQQVQRQPKNGGPKDGDVSKEISTGKPTVYRNGLWEYKK